MLVALGKSACACYTSAGILESMGKNTRTPSKLWLLMADDPGACHLARFALRLFGIGVNSASTERFFSQAGLTHTKLRNRMKHDRVTKMVQVRSMLFMFHQLDCIRSLGTLGTYQRVHTATRADLCGCICR